MRLSEPSCNEWDGIVPDTTYTVTKEIIMNRLLFAPLILLLASAAQAQYVKTYSLTQMAGPYYQRPMVSEYRTPSSWPGQGQLQLGGGLGFNPNINLNPNPNIGWNGLLSGQLPVFPGGGGGSGNVTVVPVDQLPMTIVIVPPRLGGGGNLPIQLPVFPGGGFPSFPIVGGPPPEIPIQLPIGGPAPVPMSVGGSLSIGGFGGQGSLSIGSGGFGGIRGDIGIQQMLVNPPVRWPTTNPIPPVPYTPAKVCGLCR
jgi:hypothetical protein